MESPQLTPPACSPPNSPSKKLSFSVDSLLSGSKTAEERLISSKSGETTEQPGELAHQSDHSDRSSPTSDISNTISSSNIDNHSSLSSTTSTIPSLSMAAAFQQRASFLRHSAATAAATPQLPHHALLYPWLMSAGFMPNPAASLLSPASPQSPSKSHSFLFVPPAKT